MLYKSTPRFVVRAYASSTSEPTLEVVLKPLISPHCYYACMLMMYFCFIVLSCVFLRLFFLSFANKLN